MGIESEYGVEEIGDGSWRDHAKCKSHTELFFIEGAGCASRYLAARILCFQCPVQKQCLDYAVLNSIHEGVWGGLPYRGRLAYRRGERSHKLTIEDVMKGHTHINLDTIQTVSSVLKQSPEQIQILLGVDKVSVRRRVEKNRRRFRKMKEV